MRITQVAVRRSPRISRQDDSIRDSVRDLLGTLCAWGGQIGLDSAVKMLKETLKQEKKGDKKLSQIAQKVNQAAQLIA